MFSDINNLKKGYTKPYIEAFRQTPYGKRFRQKTRDRCMRNADFRITESLYPPHWTRSAWNLKKSGAKEKPAKDTAAAETEDFSD